MENSISNAGASSSLSRTTDYSCEESSWTCYLEDFLHSQKKPSSPSRSDDQTSHVLGWDSSSSPISNQVKNDGDEVLKNSCDKLSFKKRKKRGELVDEALEDTAISPLHSPKISDLHRKKEKTLIFKKVGSLDHEREDNHCTESSLKKKGLCLVPLPMVVNYFG